MKEEALKLADELDGMVLSDDWGDMAKYYGWFKENASPMIRKLVAELKDAEGTIGRLMLEINRLNGDIATLAQEHTSMRARNERLEAERELPFEDIQKIYKEIFHWDIKNPKDNWVLLVREIEKRIKDAQKI